MGGQGHLFITPSLGTSEMWILHQKIASQMLALGLIKNFSVAIDCRASLSLYYIPEMPLISFGLRNQ